MSKQRIVRGKLFRLNVEMVQLEFGALTRRYKLWCSLTRRKPHDSKARQAYVCRLHHKFRQLVHSWELAQHKS